VPDPLLSDDQLVGEWDADARLHTVTGWVAGPAGSAGVDLPGAELDIDVAEPTRTCQLLVEAPPAGDPAALPEPTRAALLRLLGAARTAALLELAAAGAGHSARLPGPAAASPSDPFEEPAAASAPHLRAAAYSSGRRFGPGGVAPRLARLGLARLGATDDDASEAARVTAQLEAAVAAVDLPADLGLARAVAADAREGGEAILSLAAVGELDPSDARTAAELAALLRRVARLPGTGRRQAGALNQLAADLDPATSDRGDLGEAAGDFDMAVSPIVSAPLATPSERSGLLRLTAAPSGLPAPEFDAASAERVLPAGTDAVVDRRSDNEIAVTLPGQAGLTDGLWARVLRRADGLLLALAPFRAGDAHPADARATLLIPAEPSAGLVVDVTVDPAAPAPAGAARRVERALAAGRRAARAQRLGDSAAATRRWTECAQAWAEAGDERRSALAAGFAQLGYVTRSGPDALVSDRLW